MLEVREGEALTCHRGTEDKDEMEKQPSDATLPEWVFSTVLQDGANFIPTEIAQIGV